MAMIAFYAGLMMGVLVGFVLATGLSFVACWGNKEAEAPSESEETF